MKVCYVTHMSNLSGANQSLLDILKGIKHYDVDPVVLLRSHGPIEKDLNNLDINYAIIPYSTIIKKNKVKNIVKSISNKMVLGKIEKFFTDQNIDIVHNNSFACSVGMEAAYQKKIPFVCHNREIIGDDSQMRIFQQKRQYFLMGNASAAIAISDHIYSYYKKIVPDAKLFVLKDGVDITKYYIKHEPILQGATIEILFAGMINQQKGQMQAVQAMELLQQKGYTNFHLSIVGSGLERQYGKQLLDYIKLHDLKKISFYEFSDLAQFRKRSDIVLVCSHNEGLGRVTIEGQLSGCLVIGADSGGTKEIITDSETGLLYEYGNIEDLVNKLLYAAKNPSKMNNIAKDGQKTAGETFNNEKYFKDLYTLYKNILMD